MDAMLPETGNIDREIIQKNTLDDWKNTVLLLKICIHVYTAHFIRFSII